MAVFSCFGLLAAVTYMQTHLDTRSCTESAVGRVISTGGVDNTGNRAGAVDDSAGRKGKMCNESLTGARGVFVSV